MNNSLLIDMFIEGAPVSTNRMWRRARQGHLYLSDEGATWEMAVKSQVSIERIDRKVAQAAARPLRVVCEFNRVRGDADNYLKPVLDGLKYGLQIDDKHFSPVESRVVRDRTRPQGVRVFVYAAQLESDGAWQPHAPGSLRARELVDDGALARVSAAPVERVTIWPAVDYGCVVVMLPPNPLAANGGEELGLFVPLEHARQLRDGLNALGALLGAVSVEGKR